MKYLILLFAFFTLHAPLAAVAQGSVLGADVCHLNTACAVGDRTYHVKEPDGWDGITPLPVMLHFHGWARTGALPVQHDRISGHTRRRGVLLIAPNGIAQTWNFRSGSRDVAFADAVLEDVLRRYPVIREQVFVSGYSFGSAMAWRYVCESGDDIAAVFAVSGTLRQSETCAQAPRRVRHVHGLDDTVMDFPMGPGGDVLHPVRLWRDKFDCGEAEDLGAYNIVSWLEFNRFEWDCAGGDVVFDLHDGGHFIPHGWLGRMLDEELGRSPTYP